MARPDQTRTTRRVQVNVASAPAPQVGVYAPLVGNMPGKGSLGALAEALGAVVDIGIKAKPAFDDKMKKQGMADQQLGQVDERKKKWIDSYEQGVFEASVVGQYQDAQRAVVKRASEELDRTLPLDQQAAQIDAWMKEELGDLVTDDPRARLLIADRYTSFIEQTTNKILEQTVQEHQRLTLDNTVADVLDDVRNGGDGRMAEAISRIAKVSGDRSAAMTTVLGAVMAAANQSASEDDPAEAKATVERVFNLIPDEIVLDDGTKLRPRDDPGTVQTILDQRTAALNLVEKRRIEKAQEDFLGFGKEFEDANLEGRLLPWGWFESLSKRGVISDQQAVNWYAENRRAFDAAQRKSGSEAMLDQWLLDPSKDWRWHNGLQLPDGTTATDAKFQERFDYIGQRLLAQRGPEAFDQVIALSRKTGLPYTPLRTALSELGGGNVETIAEYFPRYQQLRASGMADMYVSEKAMPYWLMAEALAQTGVDPTTEKGKAQMRDKLTRLEPDRVRQWVQDGRIAINKSIGTVTVRDGWTNTSLDDLGNAAYAKAEITRLAEINLSAMLDPATSLKAAADRVRKTHSVVRVEGEEFLVPNEPGLDMGAFGDALEYFEENILPEVAKRAGKAREEVRFEIGRFGGRETEIRVVDLLGNNVSDDGTFWSPRELTTLYTDMTAEAKAAEADKDQRLKSRMVQELERQQRSGEYYERAYDTRY